MKTCRMCKNTDLTPFLNLGFHPPSDAFLTTEQLNSHEKHYPLNVCMCNNCGLWQLGFVVPAEDLYDHSYPYESSITRTGTEHFHNMAQSIVNRFSLPSSSLVIDVGSNVGVLLEGFKNQGVRILGVDPSTKIAEIANNRGIPTIPKLFNAALAPSIISEHGKATVITGTNVFAHIDDLHDIMKAIDSLLNEEGIFVFEAPYLVDLIENLEYDTIYHEHLSYLSIKPLISFLAGFGMEIFDVEKQKIHGGSIRVFIGRQGKHQISPRVQEFVAKEEQNRIYDENTLKEFTARVADNKKKLLNLLMELRNQGKRIVGVSAPAKGNTLLNYCKIDSLDYITEKSTLKIGKYSPGMHIPIVPDEKLLEDKPDYALLLAWNFAEEIMNNLQEFTNSGGKFIIPIPEPRIVGGNKMKHVEIHKVTPAHTDERGSISDIIEDENILHTGIITLNTGMERGRHYHNKAKQFNYVLKGKLQVTTKLVDNPTDMEQTHILEEGDVISIPTRVIHTFKAIEDAVFLDFNTESRSGDGYEEDVVRIPK